MRHQSQRSQLHLWHGLWFCDPQISCGLFVYFMFYINYQPLRKHTSRHSITAVIDTGTLQLDLKINHCVLIDIWKMPAQVDLHAGSIQAVFFLSSSSQACFTVSFSLRDLHGFIWKSSDWNRDVNDCADKRVAFPQHDENRAPNLRKMLYHADF